MLPEFEIVAVNIAQCIHKVHRHLLTQIPYFSGPKSQS